MEYIEVVQDKDQREPIGHIGHIERTAYREQSGYIQHIEHRGLK